MQGEVGRDVSRDTIRRMAHFLKESLELLTKDCVLDMKIAVEPPQIQNGVKVSSRLQ